MNIKLNRAFNSDAFRKWLSTNFVKEDLKRHHLRAGTVKKCYFLLCGMVTLKNPVIFQKSVEYIARNASLCKEATLKALNFLSEYRFITIKKGRGRQSNVYNNLLKESGIKLTKNLKSLPYLNFKYYSILKDLAVNKTIKGTTLSVLTCILTHAGKKNEYFLASKLTVEHYTQLDRRTIDKAFKHLESLGILNKIDFPKPSEELTRNPYNRGQAAFKVDIKKLESLCAGQLPYKKPKAPVIKPAEEVGPGDFNVFDEFLKDRQKTA